MPILTLKSSKTLPTIVQLKQKAGKVKRSSLWPTEDSKAKKVTTTMSM